MLVIASGRKTSRTTRLIELCAEYEAKGEPTYILCGTRQQAINIAQKARELKLNISFPVTYGEFMRGAMRGGRAKKILIDDADHFLQQLAGPITVAAIVVEVTPHDPE